MSANGQVQKFEAGVASGASTSSYIDTGGRAFRKMAVNYVTMSTATIVEVWGSNDSAGTFKPIRVMEPGTAAAGYNTLSIATAVSGDGWAMMDAPPHRYVQFVCTGVVSGGVSFTVLCNG
jgi:hypothetical protein